MDLSPSGGPDFFFSQTGGELFGYPDLRAPEEHYSSHDPSWITTLETLYF